MSKRKKTTLAVVSGVVILVLSIGSYNIFVLKYKDFWQIPIYHLLNLAIAILFAFYFVQRKNDTRKVKEIIEDITVKIQNEINDPDAYMFDKCFDKKTILLKARNISNKIGLLEQFQKEMDILDEVKLIRDKFQEYRETVSEEIENQQALIARQKEFEKILQLIDNKCYDLRIKLYK